jgi:hypothetical protein
MVMLSAFKNATADQCPAATLVQPKRLIGPQPVSFFIELFNVGA